MRDFQRIKAWQRAHALSVALHKRTKRFPRAGYARLSAQLTGAVDSIKDTIAEGRWSTRIEKRSSRLPTTNDGAAHR